jgi:hypothetical protein
VNQRCLDAAVKAASMKIRGSVEAGSSIYSIDVDMIDETIRQSPDAQLMTLAVLRPTLNFALQDAYFDAGLASNFEPMDVDLSPDEERKALRESVDFFPKCGLNLDMRYRYMFVADVSSDAEDHLWNEMTMAVHPIVRRSFEQRSDLHPFWVGVLSRLAEGDAEGARQILAEAF